MTCYKGMCKLIEVVSGPFVIIGCAGNGRRRIGDSTAQYNVGTLVQGLDNSPCAKVALCIDWIELPVR
jgi:hypothetical protein